MLFCKQGSTADLMIGPFVDSSGAAITGLTITAAEILLAKHSTSSFVAKNSGGATHVSNGYYSITLNATDLTSAGRLQLFAADTTTTHMPVYHELMVLPANVADSIYLGTDLLQVDVEAIGDDTTAATNLYRLLSGCVIGQAVTGTLSADTFTTNISAVTYPGASTDNFFNGKNFVFVTGNLKGQGGVISDYVGSTKTIVCDPLSSAPANNDYFMIF